MKERKGTAHLARGHCVEAAKLFLPELLAQGTDDCDACLCALMALAWLLKGRHPNIPRMMGPPTITSDIKREGWIFYPDEPWAPRSDK